MRHRLVTHRPHPSRRASGIGAGVVERPLEVVDDRQPLARPPRPAPRPAAGPSRGRALPQVVQVGQRPAQLGLELGDFRLPRWSAAAGLGTGPVPSSGVADRPRPRRRLLGPRRHSRTRSRLAEGGAELGSGRHPGSAHREVGVDHVVVPAAPRRSRDPAWPCASAGRLAVRRVVDLLELRGQASQPVERGDSS